MATAITPLANITLGSPQASISFSSISQSYRDLRLVIITGSSGTSGAFIRMNSDTGSNYYTVLTDGTSASGNGTSITTAWNVYGTTLTQIYTIDFMDYSVTDKHKTVLARSGDTNTAVQMTAGRWANTTAVTSIQIITGSGNLITGTTAMLYGVSA